MESKRKKHFTRKPNDKTKKSKKKITICRHFKQFIDIVKIFLKYDHYAQEGSLIDWHFTNRVTLSGTSITVPIYPIHMCNERFVHIISILSTDIFTCL